MLKVRLVEQIQKLNDNHTNLETVSENQMLDWSKSKQNEIKAKMDEIKLRLKEKRELLEHSDKSTTKCFNKSVKRMAQSLLEENRIKRRKCNLVGKRKLDSDDEDYLLDIIEGQRADPYGRRYDAVCYVHKKVTNDKLQQMLNTHRQITGKSKLRSSSTVYNRMKPINKRHRQAKAHIGKGLFCIHKPPKTENNDI